MRFANHLVVPLLFATLSVALTASAQSPLSLSEAIARAKASNPDAGSAAAAEREAAERVTQVRGGYFQRWTSRSPGSAATTRCSCSVRFLRSGTSARPTSPLMRSLTHLPWTTSARRSPSSSRCSTSESLHASIVRIVADANGGSHFEDAVDTLVPTDFAPPAPPLGVSEPAPAAATRFIGASAGWDSPPHPAPAPQWARKPRSI
jgi:hypothetical protein